jgi:predicted acyltransferase (DUF342 family)
MKFLILLLIGFAWLLLPLIPAIRELLKPTDTDPLKVVSRESSAISFFANNFRSFFLTQADQYNFSSLKDFEPATFSDGTPFIRVQGRGRFPVRHDSSQDLVDYLVIVGNDAVFPDNTTFLREIYAVRSMTGGRSCIYRAILAEERLTIPEDCIVLRWAHCVEKFSVGDYTVLHGRASSDRALVLGQDVQFEWIAAPVISVGPLEEKAEVKKGIDGLVTFEFKDMIEMPGGKGTYRCVGDLPIGNRNLVTGSLVVTGELDIGEETVIKGNLKCYGKTSIGAGCVVEGSIVTRSPLQIGENCVVNGPVISEEEITIGAGSVIGTEQINATISAPQIYLNKGVVIKGMVIAESEGKTI